MFLLKLLLQALIVLPQVQTSSLKYRPKCTTDYIFQVSNNKTFYHDNPDVSYYIWNKTSQSLHDYHNEICTDRCDHGVKINGIQTNRSILCSECECERPACEIYDICCEDLSEDNTSSKHSTPSLAPPTLYCDPHTVRDFNFLYIRSCSGSFHGDNKIKSLCMNDVNENETTIDTFMRVIDTETQAVYYNMYCAKCNHVEK
ncbi:hypothetical protein BgiBS90_037201, partial [Biomphalaria glabrata]